MAWNEDMASRHEPEAFHERSGLVVRLLERARVDAVRRLLEAGPEHAVLEVGCGPGVVLERLPGRRTGLELSARFVARAAQRRGPTLRVVRGDGAALPFRDASFDRVVCTEVLEHVLDPAQVIREVARVVRPGGRVVLTVPEERTIDRAKRLLGRLGLFRLVLGDRRAGQYQPPPENDWHLHELDLAALRGLAAPFLVEERAVRLPSRLVPVHDVVAYRPRGGQDLRA